MLEFGFASHFHHCGQGLKETDIIDPLKGKPQKKKVGFMESGDNGPKSLSWAYVGFESTLNNHDTVKIQPGTIRRPKG